MENKLITSHDATTGQTIVREMSDEEYANYQKAIVDLDLTTLSGGVNDAN
jgi:hypothetical protein